jgi:transposase
MGSTRRSFTDEYKREAARLILEQGRPIVEVAHNIGVHENTIGKWVRKVRESTESEPQLTPDTPLSEGEQLEVARLRGELKNANATIAELRMQVEFAKKVATWFAKDQQ